MLTGYMENVVRHFPDFYIMQLLWLHPEALPDSISKDDEFPLDIDERRLPVIAITQAHSVLKGMTKLKNRVSDFVMKPYIDELVRLRTNNLLKINISGSANEKYFSRTK